MTCSVKTGVKLQMESMNEQAKGMRSFHVKDKSLGASSQTLSFLTCRVFVFSPCKMRLFSFGSLWSFVILSKTLFKINDSINSYQKNIYIYALKTRKSRKMIKKQSLLCTCQNNGLIADDKISMFPQPSGCVKQEAEPSISVATSWFTTVTY